MKVRRHLIMLMALAVPVLFQAASTVPAEAVGVPVGTYQLENIYYIKCLTEDGDTGSIYLQTCATGSNINHSQLWKFTAFGQFVNDHSGLCLIVTGYEAGVWLTSGTACTTKPITVAEWTPASESMTTITNDHTQDYLDADVADNGTIIQSPYLLSARFWDMVPIP